jgi:serine/threonine protein kinase
LIKKGCVLQKHDGWEVVGEPLGRGGQGTVYRARRPERARQLEQIAARVGHLLRQVSAAGPTVSISDLARRIVEIGSPDPCEHLGALKLFTIPSDDKAEEAKAVGRLETEVRALSKVDHPAVLKLLHANTADRFIVTEYHPSGTLDRNLARYRGDALVALQEFRELVEGIVEIHKQGAIHRDIKPENIFVAKAGRGLVLGDFGIVFFQDGSKERLTSTYGERVGTHYWMAPWAYDTVRLNSSEVRPTLDIYPLGKVLWSMISGRNGFLFWEFDWDENNLERMFPDDPIMSLVNGLLAKCVVRDEKGCRLSTATDLCSEVDSLINQAKAWRRGGPEGTKTWPCRICGRGFYRKADSLMANLRLPGNKPESRDIPFYACDRCHHVEFFLADRW